MRVVLRLCAADNGIGAEGAAKVAAMLEKNTTLTSIHLYGAPCTPAVAAAGATPRARVCATRRSRAGQARAARAMVASGCDVRVLASERVRVYVWSCAYVCGRQ